MLKCVLYLQRIRSTVEERDQKQLLMDLDVVMRSNECPYIVQFYGALFKEVRILFRLDVFMWWVPNGAISKFMLSLVVYRVCGKSVVLSSRHCTIIPLSF